MTRSFTTLAALCLSASAVCASEEPAALIEELKACAGIKERVARYACFDELGARALQEEPANADPEKSEVELPADAGLPALTDRQAAASDEYSGTITACEQGLYGTWYFYFDNGQIWKEARSRNRRFRDCSFDATISKDFFGYKMQIEDVGKAIRVIRHQ